MTALARKAELIKLGRLLGAAPDELAALAPDDAGELRALREGISAALFDDVRPMLTRVAKGSRLLPTSLVARVGQAAFGALLCSRIASLLAPDHALAVALHMPDAFLADVSAQIDPRSAGDVVRMIPTERIVAVAGVLVARRDYVTMGRFVDYLSDATLAAVIASIPDELDLLHIATFVESPAKLGELLGMLPPPRLRAMIARMSDGDGELWLELLAIATSLDAGWQRVLADTAAACDPAVLDALVTSGARTPAAWPALLAIAAQMHLDAQHRVATLVGQHLPALLAPLAEAARRADLWDALLPLAVELAPAHRTTLLTALLDASAVDAATRRTMVRAFIAAAEVVGRAREARALVDELPAHLRD